jgi:glycosyltransferase involved in cell wall biosynthesis
VSEPLQAEPVGLHRSAPGPQRRRLARPVTSGLFVLQAILAGLSARDLRIAVRVLVKRDARRTWRRLFDGAEYCHLNPDVAAAGLPPGLHYLLRGHLEGREPSRLFSAAHYLALHPDVARARLNPLAHYCLHGVREGRDWSAPGPAPAPETRAKPAEPGAREAPSVRVNTRWRDDAPLVSVVILSFNYGRYLQEALESVLKQTWSDLEVIVVDGGSTDPDSVAEVRRLEAVGLPRVRFLYRDGRKLTGDNRNYGIQHARGRYVCCLDADDRLDPVYIEVAVFLAECGGFDVVYPSVRCFGESDFVWLLTDARFPDILAGNAISTVGLFRRSVWAEVGGFRDWGLGPQYVPEDWDFWTRILGHGYRVKSIRKPLLEYRVHHGNLYGIGGGDLGSHAQQVLEANRHLLEHWEIRQVAARRPVEVINGQCNIADPRRSPARRSSILFALPFVTVGGGEHLLASLAEGLAERGHGIVVTTCMALPDTMPAALEFFQRITPNVYDLPHLFADDEARTRFVLYLLDRHEVDTVILAGSRLVYELLPEIRRCRPHIAIVDQLFNDVGHVDSNREFRDAIDLTLVPSEPVRESLVANHGADPEGVLVIPHGLPGATSRLDRPRRTVELPAEVPVVAFFGRFSLEKAPDVFVEIARKLAPEVPAIFLMTGEGPMREMVVELIRRYGLEDRVLTPGFVADLQPLLDRADVVVIPSRLDGMPLVALEAMAARKPLVVSRVGSLPTVVSNGVTGFVCAPGDVDAFCCSIRTLLEDPALRHRLGAAGRQVVNREYSSETMVQRYVDVLETASDLAVRRPTLG